MIKWCIENPFFTFVLFISVLIVVDNALSNLSKVQVAKYESKKENQ
jgi:hypothetical protein